MLFPSLGSREVMTMRHASESHEHTIVMLPFPTFLNRMGVDENEAKKHHKMVIIQELQQKIALMDKNLVVGWDVKRNRVCWYAVAEGHKPYTSVPFYVNVPDWKQSIYPDELEEYDRGVWKDMEERFRETHRAIAGIPIPRKPWYQGGKR